MAREEKTSTVANGGVAFPHAWTELVEDILLDIGWSKSGHESRWIFRKLPE